MTSTKANLSPTDDGIAIQRIVKRGLIALSIAIVLLSGVALITIFQLTGFYKQKVNVIVEQDNLIHVMHAAARNRSLYLYMMLNEKDPFLKEEHHQAYFNSGAEFIKAREKFSRFTLTGNELFLFVKQGKLASANQAKQTKVIALLQEGKKEIALQLLKNEAIPGQQLILDALDQLHKSIKNQQNDIFLKADYLGNISITILIALVIIIIIGALYIIRRTTSRSFNIIRQADETRKLLQATIHELIQQKDTLDNHAIVSIADRQGNITYVNDKFCEISGFSREELIGNNHRIVKSEKHSADFYLELWRTISQGKVWKGKICNRRKDGSHYWVESTISPFLNDKGIPYQYVSIRTDITALLKSKLEAEEANKAKNLFLSSMSHELRTPMNAILGFSQLMEMQAIDEETKENFREIIAAGNHLMELINEILDFSQIESGNLRLNIDNYNPKDIIKFCLSLMQPLADKMSVKIEHRINSIPDIKIRVDEKRFRQVVLNLVSNAIRYNKEYGSVIIDYSVTEDKMLYLSITDTGKGIPLHHQNNLFTPFNRAGEEGSNITGSGLGLVISKNLLEKMNGSIGFNSTDKEGSCFWIKVPLV